MARIIQTALLTREEMAKDPQLRDWMYNGLDAMVTAEILPKIQAQFEPNTWEIYRFALSLRAPLMEMMLFGCRVDHELRAKLTNAFDARRKRLEHILNRVSWAIWKQDLNPQSHVQLKQLFYRHMALPEQYKFDKGERKVSVGREALEKLQDFFWAKFLIRLILDIRDCDKKLSVLRGGRSKFKNRGAIFGGDNVISADGRFRTSVNIGGTESGRLSSTASVFDTGTNSQNITEELRQIFITDPKKKMAYLDLSSAESVAVAFLSGDENYKAACLSGDVHTYVSRLCWENDYPWTGVLAHDRHLAETTPGYRHFSIRDLGKRGGHLSNYYGKPFTMARHLRLPVYVTEDFQERYFGAFPGIPRWHQSCATQLHAEGFLTTALGFQRYFFGRRYDDTTLREAIAFEPQSLVAFILNAGLIRIWSKFRHCVHLLFQVHDAVLVEYPEEMEGELIPQLIDCLRIPVEVRGQTMCIDADAQVGWNWRKMKSNNPDGLIKWTGQDERTRRTNVSDSLDNILYGLHAAQTITSPVH